MYLLVILATLFILLYCIFYKKSKTIEKFFPAWQDHTIYSQLSRRVNVGIWRGWLNINNLLLSDKLLEHTNMNLIIYETNNEVIDALLITKKIDIGIVTEADYGIYLTTKLENENKGVFTKETMIKNKKTILHNFNTRRLFTFYKLYRFLIVNNLRINKPSDLDGNTLEITNLTNQIYKLDLDLLKNIKYTKVYRDVGRGVSQFDSVNKLGMQIDGYFTQYDYPNPVLSEITSRVNCTLIDLYSDGNKDNGNKDNGKKDNGNKIVTPDKILKKYFYLNKDKMSLDAYPELVARRKDIIDFYGLPYKSNSVNCYSFKMIMLSRSDVQDEWIYLFTKSIMDNLHSIKKDIPYLHEVSREGMYKSTLSDILPIHPAVFEQSKYSF
jgi:TRAP-type uncharacterized transport system substrate-binding protein